MKTQSKQLLAGVILAVGLVVLVGSASQTDAPTSGVTVYADFPTVEGLQVGDRVEMSGIAIGTVAKMELTSGLRAKVAMQVNKQFPEDSSASVVSTGLFGNKIVAIEVGGSEELIQAGDSLILTEGSIVLDKLLDAIAPPERLNKESSTQ